MVAAMDRTPLYRHALGSRRAEDRQKNPKRTKGFKRPVREKTVKTDCHAEAGGKYIITIVRISGQPEMPTAHRIAPPMPKPVGGPMTVTSIAIRWGSGITSTGNGRRPNARGSEDIHKNLALPSLQSSEDTTPRSLRSLCSG